METNLEFATYEEYLDSQITPLDLYYLEDKELARQLVELGYRGSGEPLKREEFEMKKKAAETFRLAKRTDNILSSQGKDFSSSPFLAALAEREEANRTGNLSTILFIRTRNLKGQEVSGYIDYAHRLKTEDFEFYFDGTKPFLPKTTDLSFYNWETLTCTSNPSPNFQVIADGDAGLMFKNKRDRKVISVDARDKSDTTVRTEIKTHEHIQVVIYDHLTRRKI